MTADEQRLATLKTKLNARRGMPGFEANVRAIEEEIARIEARNDQGDDQ